MNLGGFERRRLQVRGPKREKKAHAAMFDPCGQILRCFTGGGKLIATQN